MAPLGVGAYQWTFAPVLKEVEGQVKGFFGGGGWFHCDILLTEENDFPLGTEASRSFSPLFIPCMGSLQWDLHEPGDQEVSAIQPPSVQLSAPPLYRDTTVTGAELVAKPCEGLNCN